MLNLFDVWSWSSSHGTAGNLYTVHWWLFLTVWFPVIIVYNVLFLFQGIVPAYGYTVIPPFSFANLHHPRTLKEKQCHMRELAHCLKSRHVTSNNVAIRQLTSNNVAILSCDFNVVILSCDFKTMRQFYHVIIMPSLLCTPGLKRPYCYCKLHGLDLIHRGWCDKWRFWLDCTQVTSAWSFSLSSISHLCEITWCGKIFCAVFAHTKLLYDAQP